MQLIRGRFTFRTFNKIKTSNNETFKGFIFVLLCDSCSGSVNSFDKSPFVKIRRWEPNASTKEESHCTLLDVLCPCNNPVIRDNYKRYQLQFSTRDREMAQTITLNEELCGQAKANVPTTKMPAGTSVNLILLKQMSADTATAERQTEQRTTHKTTKQIQGARPHRLRELTLPKILHHRHYFGSLFKQKKKIECEITF